MRLYHGTSAAFLSRILGQGLLPRGKRASNWEKAPSRNDCVYLTDAYAPYFCFASLENKEQGVVIEVEPDPATLLPDEDVLEQLNRGKDGVPGTMEERVEYYRNRLELYTGQDQWQASLKVLGTCCALGKIPVSRIKRVAFIPQDYFWFWDANISLANYHFLGASYRAQMARLFGDEPVNPPTGPFADKWKVPMTGHSVWTVIDGQLDAATVKQVAYPDERSGWAELQLAKELRLAKEAERIKKAFRTDTD